MINNSKHRFMLSRSLVVQLPIGVIPVASRVEIAAHDDRDGAKHRSILIIGHLTTDAFEGPALITEDEWLNYLSPTTGQTTLTQEYLGPLLKGSDDP